MFKRLLAVLLAAGVVAFSAACTPPTLFTPSLHLLSVYRFQTEVVLYYRG